MLAAVLEDELLAAIGAFLLLVHHAIRHVFLQCAGDAILPCVDAVFLHVEVLHQLNHVLDGHSVAQDAGNQLGVVPIFLVERAREPLHHHFIAVLVGVAEVVACAFIFGFLFDNQPFLNVWRQEEVLGFAQENLVGLAVQLAHEGNPFLVVVLEAHHITLQLFRTRRG